MVVLTSVALVMGVGAELTSRVTGATDAWSCSAYILTSSASNGVGSLVAEVATASAVLLPKVKAVRTRWARVLVLIGTDQAVLMAKVANICQSQVGSPIGSEGIARVACLVLIEPEVQVRRAGGEALKIGLTVRSIIRESS